MGQCKERYRCCACRGVFTGTAAYVTLVACPGEGSSGVSESSTLRQVF